MDRDKRIRAMMAEINNDLTSAEATALEDTGRAFSTIMPDEIREILISKGYIEQKLGGLMRTTKGDLYCMKFRQSAFA